MRRLAVMVNRSKAGAVELARGVCERLQQAGLEVMIPKEYRETFPELENCFLSQDCYSQCDALIAIGGDGTILTAARLVLPYRKPVLGINAGRMGFLAGLERHEIGLLQQLSTENYMLQQRMLLQVQVRDGACVVHEQRCLNDAVISRHTISRLVELSVMCDGHVLTYFGDGVIFSTPTGSTAYSFSAGGPVVDPQIETILLTPICNHRLFSRAVVFSPSTSFTVTIAREGMALTCDAEPPFPLLAGQTVTVCRADETAQFIWLKAGSFLDILNEKMLT